MISLSKQLILITLLSASLSIIAQTPTLHLLDSLPDNFSYHLSTSALHKLKDGPKSLKTTYFNDSLVIGCIKPLKVKPEFSLAIDHSFLFSENWDSLKSIGFKLILYAIKKTNLKRDSIFLQAHNEYCVYGQANYAFLSRDYIVFTYNTINTAGIIGHLKKMDLWPLIEQTIIHNLDSQCTINSRKTKATTVEDIKKRDRGFAGSYEQYSTPLPDNTVFKGSKLLTLKKNYTLEETVNYNQPKSSHYHYKGKWITDSRFLYINVEGWGAKAFKIIGNETFIHPDGRYGLIPKTPIYPQKMPDLNKLTYTTIISETCKKTTDGGCMISTHCFFAFGKDSVTVSYNVVAHCTPKEREKDFEFLNKHYATQRYKYFMEENSLFIGNFSDFNGMIMYNPLVILAKDKKGRKVEFQKVNN